MADPVITDITAAENTIRSVLDSLRPALATDEGDITLVNVTPDGFVEVRFLGNCATCSLNLMTLRAGVERMIKLGVPEVKRVEMV